MQNNDEHRSGGMWQLLGLATIPILCCGLPIFIGAIGTTAAGAFLAASRYWILGGLVLLAGLVMFGIMARKGKASKRDAYCAIPPRKKQPNNGVIEE